MSATNHVEARLVNGQDKGAAITRQYLNGFCSQLGQYEQDLHWKFTTRRYK